MEKNLNNILSTLKYTDAYLITLYNATGDPKLQPIIAQVEDNIGKVNKTLIILKKLEEAIKDSNNPSGMLAELKTSIDKMDDAINLLANNRDAINQKIIGASSKLSLVNTKWPTIRSAIQTASLKLNSISEADLDSMIEFSNINQDDVKNYFESPVELNKKHVYAVDNYGSALSPFYISVSLWIGCIIAVAMITMRVKTRKKYSAETIYLGRMGLFLIISIMQALVVAVGALMLGIQVSSALLFTLTTLYIGLCLMVVIYSLTSAFGNAGKAIAIILLVLQITATGGTFPVEILPSFFQAIHPYLPLTYVIGALREVVAGVLWSNFWYCIGILALFPTLAFGLTLLIKERMDKRAQWTENKLKESGLF
jgi:putative membrane protein